MPSVADALHKAARFIGHHGIGVFRSALFLASLMVILEHFPVVEWLNVVMFRVLHAVARPSIQTGHAESGKTVEAKALVFTIQQELFETAFRSRSPIDREVLLEYLIKLDKVYHLQGKVLAIDYDLSPNYEANKECTIKDSTEEIWQYALDDILLSLSRRGVKVVLIKHIPVENTTLCECKTKWELEKYDLGKGILFGNPDLMHYDLGLVVKYAEREDSFPAVVRAAEKLADPKKLAAGEKVRLPPMQLTCGDPKPSAHESGDRTAQLIHFSKAVDSVKVCALDEPEAFKRCKDAWSAFGIDTEDSKVIFFGGHYGLDDIYVTPVGEKAGVTIQAYTYFSQGDPLKTMLPWKAWGIEIAIGIVGGLVFHLIWHGFHHYRQHGNFTLQFTMALLAFTALSAFIYFVGRWIADFLAKGIWLHPVPMFVGLFIDSYIATATSTEGGNTHEGAWRHPTPRVIGLFIGRHMVATTTIEGGDTPKGQASNHFTSLLHKLLGIPDAHVSGLELFFRSVLKIVVFWITVGMAVCSMLWLHH